MSNLRSSIAGSICRYFIVGKLMDDVVKWILWIEGLAPFDHFQLLRTAEERVILRRLDRDRFSFVHPLMMDYFAHAAEPGSVATSSSVTP